MLQLAYSSAATVPLSDEDLQRLVEISRENNARADVTGILLFYEDSFLQLLEGPLVAVNELYDRIGEDPRHRCLRLLCRSLVSERMFPDWSMGFVRLQPEWVRAAPGLGDFFGRKGLAYKRAGSEAMRQLKKFRGDSCRQWVDDGRPLVALAGSRMIDAVPATPQLAP